MNFKKIILPVVLVAMVGAYIVYQQFFSGANNPAPVINSNPNPTPSQSTNPPVTQSGYKDGQYTGAVANTVYGDVQVKAIISGGKITDVQFLTYPNHMGHSVEVSMMSMPLLKSEAIQAQSSHVDVVSGATQTSEGFMQSLASALAKAV